MAVKKASLFVVLTHLAVLYKDGARINNPLNATNIPSTETANIERIEILKGPAALMFGSGMPGGIINYITKRPEFSSYKNIELITGM